MIGLRLDEDPLFVPARALDSTRIGKDPGLGINPDRRLVERPGGDEGCRQSALPPWWSRSNPRPAGQVALHALAAGVPAEQASDTAIFIVSSMKTIPSCSVRSIADSRIGLVEERLISSIRSSEARGTTAFDATSSWASSSSMDETAHGGSFDSPGPVRDRELLANLGLHLVLVEHASVGFSG